MTRTIPLKETLTIEFKSDLKKYGDAPLFEDVVAFANTEGGDLYLGVEDDGTITGVHREHSDPLTLSAYIANNTVPPLSTRCEIIEEGPSRTENIGSQVLRKHCGDALWKDTAQADQNRRFAGKRADVPTEMVTRLSDLRVLDYSSMILLEGTLADIDPLEMERLRRIILAYDGDKSLLDWRMKSSSRRSASARGTRAARSIPPPPAF